MKKNNNTYAKIYVFTLSLLLFICNNLVHAVTPDLIKSIHADKWMNGSYFAFMALSGFLFIPMFGKMSDIIGRKKLLVISILIYALGQWLFGMSTNKWVIHIYRLISGMGGPTIFVLLNATLADVSDKKQISKYMVGITLISQIATGIGKYIGGVLGENGYIVTFNVQVISLLIISIIAWLLFPKYDDEINQNSKKETENFNYKEIITNSFKWTKDITWTFITSFVGIFLTGYLFFAFSQVIFSNNIVFFISDQLKLSPTIIGEFMLAMSLCAIIALLIISPIMSRFLPTHSSIYLSLFSAILFLSLSLIINENKLILSSILILIYFIFTVIIEGFINGYVLENMDGEYGSGYILSLIQSFAFIGRFLGSLISGFMFQINDYLPFIFGLILLILFLVLFYIHRTKIKKAPTLNEE